MIVDWLKCGLLDVGLLGAETLFNVWFALNLRDAGLFHQFQGILSLMVLPNLLNAGIWYFGLRKTEGGNISKDWIMVFLLVLFGFPCPMFVYIRSIYMNIFGHKRRKNARITANIFRIVQALSYSVPILLINITTIVGSLKSEDTHGNTTLNVNSLSTHINEVKIHGIAFFIGFLNVIRSSSLYNEQQTFSLLFVTTGLPFQILTILTRLLISGFVLAFLRWEWIVLSYASLLCFNLILYIGLQKRSFEDDDKVNAEGDEENSEDSVAKVDFNQGGFNCLPHLPKILLLSILSVFIPSAYSNDCSSRHPRLKGGTFILLNYFANGTLMALTLGVTIFHFTPDDINGLALSQPALNVQVPQGKAFVNAMGMKIRVDLPNQNLDLASMPSVTANFNTSESDGLIAVLLPSILLLLPLPFVVMRALMSELDCFLTRRRDLQSHDPEKDDHQYEGFLLQERTCTEPDVLHEIHRNRLQERSLSCRLYIAIAFGFLGLLIVSLTFIASLALAVVNLKH